MSEPRSEAETAKLNALLDRIIPPGPARGIPGAGELGVASLLLERAAREPGLADCIRQVTEAAADSGHAMSLNLARQIEEEVPEAFAQRVAATYVGYYSRADVRPHFGVGAHAVHPAGYPVAAENPEKLEELTAPVRGRGACYRAAGGSGPP